MEKQHINPTGIYKHPAFTRIVTVKGPMKMIFIAGQTPSDENYRCVAPGDLKAQYIQVMENLQAQLETAGATWDDVVYRRTFVLDVDECRTRPPRASRQIHPRQPERMPSIAIDLGIDADRSAWAAPQSGYRAVERPVSSVDHDRRRQARPGNACGEANDGSPGSGRNKFLTSGGDIG